MATQTSFGQIQEKTKKLKKVRSIKLSRKPSLRDRVRTRFRPPPPIDPFADIGLSEEFQGITYDEGVPDRPSTSGSSSSTPSSIRHIKGGNGVNSKSRFHPPDVIELSDSSPNSMATSCSDSREAHFHTNPSSSFGNDDDHCNTPDLDSSVKKPIRSLSRSSTMKNRRILLGNFKSKRPSVKKNTSESQNTSADRATYSSTVRASKFPHQAQHGCGEDIHSMKVCTYNYCSVHGHYHAPATPPRLVPRRRNLLKSQKSIKLKSTQGAKRSAVAEKDIRKMKANEEEDGAVLDGFVFGATTYAEKSLQERAYKNLVEGTNLAPNEEIDATVEANSSSGSCEADPEAMLDDGVAYSPEEEESGGSAAKEGESVEVSSTMQISKEKHISMWHMIHQHLGGVGNDQVVKADAASAEKMDLENREAEIQDLELRKINAVKLVKEAIEKILLPEVQDQPSDDQSIAGNGISEQQKNNCENKEIDKTTDGEETVKKTPKSWSYLKKWILLQRFIKELDKVKKLNFQSPRYLDLEPESEKEKVHLRPTTLSGRKSAETWMLDYALQHVVSELAPTQKRKVALLVEAFESIAPPLSGEKRTYTTTSFKLEETDPKNQDHESYTCGNKENKAVVASSASVSDQLKELGTAGEVKGGDIVTDIEFVEGFIPLGDSRANNDFRSEIEYVDGFTPVRDSRVSVNIKPEIEFIEGFTPVEVSRASVDIESDIEFVEGFTPVGDSRASVGIKSEIEFVEEFTPVGDSEVEATAFESNKARSSEVKNISMWHLIHNQMASGLAAEAETGFPDSGTDKKRHVDDNNNWLAQKNSGSDSSFHDSGLNKTIENHDSDNKEFEHRKLSAVKLVKEAIEKILLPEVEDQSSDDIQSNTGMLGAEDEGNVSTVETKSVKKTPKSWSRLKKVLLLKKFVNELEKVRKLDAFKPRPRQALEAEAKAEAEKVCLKPQKTGEGKNSDEWMLDHALRQAINELAPTQKRKVSLLVKAFETVVPPSKEERSQAEEIVASTNSTLPDKQSSASDPSVSMVRARESYNDRSYTCSTNGCDPLEQLSTSTDTKKIENSEVKVKANYKTQMDKQRYIVMWHQIYQHVVTDVAEKVLDEDGDEEKARAIGFSQSDAVKLVQESVNEILLPENQETVEEEEEDRAVSLVGRLKSKNWSKLKRLILLQRSIKTLESMRKTDHHRRLPSKPNEEEKEEAEKIDLNHQMMEERKKAEQWMLDYAVQHIVTTLTPARKRRVSLLVEAFEAVVPLPPELMNFADQ